MDLIQSALKTQQALENQHSFGDDSECEEERARNARDLRAKLRNAILKDFHITGREKNVIRSLVDLLALPSESHDGFDDDLHTLLEILRRKISELRIFNREAQIKYLTNFYKTSKLLNAHFSCPPMRKEGLDDPSLCAIEGCQNQPRMQSKCGHGTYLCFDCLKTNRWLKCKNPQCPWDGVTFLLLTAKAADAEDAI